MSNLFVPAGHGGARRPFINNGEELNMGRDAIMDDDDQPNLRADHGFEYYNDNDDDDDDDDEAIIGYDYNKSALSSSKIDGGYNENVVNNAEGAISSKYSILGQKSASPSPPKAAPSAFIAADRFSGARAGYYFSMGKSGLGYYLDSRSSSISNNTSDRNRNSNSNSNNASTRSNVNGSTNANSNNSNYTSDLNFDHDDDNSGGSPRLVGEDEENDQVPKMPGEFYEHVDSFLKRPAPKIKVKGGDKSSSNSNSNSSSVNSGHNSNRNQQSNLSILQQTSNTLPVIKAPTLSSLPQPPPQFSRTTSKIKQIISGRDESKLKDIDTNLLMQAFAYTEQLTMANLKDDEEEHAAQESSKRGKNQKHHTPSGSSNLYMGGNEDGFEDEFENDYSNNNSGRMGLGNTSGLPPSGSKKQSSSSSKKVGGGGSKKPGKAGLVNKVRKQAASDLNHPDFNGATATQEEDPRRNALDFDGLLANFEQGLTLSKLRAELEESQRSLRSTNDAMKKLTRDTVQGRR